MPVLYERSLSIRARSETPAFMYDKAISKACCNLEKCVGRFGAYLKCYVFLMTVFAISPVKHR